MAIRRGETAASAGHRRAKPVGRAAPRDRSSVG